MRQLVTFLPSQKEGREGERKEGGGEREERGKRGRGRGILVLSSLFPFSFQTPAMKWCYPHSECTFIISRNILRGTSRGVLKPVSLTVKISNHIHFHFQSG